MKRLTAILLLLGVCFVGGLVVYATTALAGSNGSFEAWLTAQRQTPALWALDAVAGYTMLLTLGYGEQAARLGARNAQIERLQGEHHTQLEAMLTNTEKVDEINAAQSDRIATQEEKIAAQATRITMQEETIRSLSEQTTALQNEVARRQHEIDARQEAFENEARRLTEQAFLALSGQVDAQSRQLDAVNLALQYHRAELQQLRTGLRAVQAMPEPTRVARLTPAELAAIESPHFEGELRHDAPLSDTSYLTPDMVDFAPDTADIPAAASDVASGINDIETDINDVDTDTTALASEPAEAMAAALSEAGNAASEPAEPMAATAEIASDATMTVQEDPVAMETAAPLEDPLAPVAADLAPVSGDLAPVAEDLIPVAADRPAPMSLTANGQDAVIMEPVYFRLVAVQEEAPAAHEQSAAQEAAVRADEPVAIVSAAEASDTGTVTLDEQHALVTPLSDASVAASSAVAGPTHNSGLAAPVTRPWFARWQRKQ